MESERHMLVSPEVEVPVIEGELVTAIRTLASRGAGSKAIARQLGVARNTVRRYLRTAVEAGMQVRPAAKRLTEDVCRAARALYEGPAGGNAVVVQRLLAEHGTAVSVRTVERAVVDLRRAPAGGAVGDRPCGIGPWRPDAGGLRAKAPPDCGRVGPGVRVGRGPQLLASPLRESVSE